MVTPLKIQAEVTESRRLVIDLPADMPLGKIEVVITPQVPALTVEEARAKLRAAGLLSEIPEPKAVEPLSPQELLALTQFLPKPLTLDEVIDEGRED